MTQLTAWFSQFQPDQMAWIYWARIAIGLVLLIGVLVRAFPRTWIWYTFEALYDAAYTNFQWILPNPRDRWIVKYITILFFILFIVNIASVIFDPIASVTGINELTNEFSLSGLITLATGDIHFNIVIATISILIMLYAQGSAQKSKASTSVVGFFEKAWRTLYEYIPLFGKNLITIERGEMSAFVYWPIAIVVKLFDIAVSLFVWVLDIVWLWAKIISLAARLFGNMVAWWTLSVLVITWAWAIFWWLLALIPGLDAVDFPFLLPILIYLQWLLVAVIQAFVFPLLVAIFIKVAQNEDEAHPVTEAVEEFIEQEAAIA